MENVLQVFIRSVYGNQLVYPHNDDAKKFAKLLGVKSFTKSQLGQIESLGYALEQVLDPRDSIKLGSK